MSIDREVPWNDEQGIPEKETPKLEESEKQKKADKVFFGGSEGAGIEETPFDTAEREAEDFVDDINKGMEEIRRLLKEHRGPAPSDKMQFLDYEQKAEEQKTIREAISTARMDIEDFQRKYDGMTSQKGTRQHKSMNAQLEHLNVMKAELNAAQESLDKLDAGKILAGIREDKRESERQALQKEMELPPVIVDTKQLAPKRRVAQKFPMPAEEDKGVPIWKRGPDGKLARAFPDKAGPKPEPKKPGLLGRMKKFFGGK